MSINSYTGTIGMFAGTYVPRGWYPCNGQEISIAQASALFSVIGTFYGGNGYATFKLPNFNDSFALGLSHIDSPATLGRKFGTDTLYIPIQGLPAHTHTMHGSKADATAETGMDTLLAQPQSRFTTKIYAPYDSTQTVPMYPGSIQHTGNNAGIPYMPPYLGVIFGICVYGIYPPRP